MAYAVRNDGQGWRAVASIDDVGEGETFSELQPAPIVDVRGNLTAAVQAHLDAGAQALGYDNIFTAVTYADEPAVAKFQAEGEALRAWRSKVWDKCYVIMADVESGKQAVPTADELIAELPLLQS